MIKFPFVKHKIVQLHLGKNIDLLIAGITNMATMPQIKIATRNTQYIRYEYRQYENKLIEVKNNCNP